MICCHYFVWSNHSLTVTFHDTIFKEKISKLIENLDVDDIWLLSIDSGANCLQNMRLFDKQYWMHISQLNLKHSLVFYYSVQTIPQFCASAFRIKMSNKCNWRLEAISKAAVNRKKNTFVLKAGENTVGKRKDNHIKIPSALCSRDHCSIFLEGDNVTVKDIVSK